MENMVENMIEIKKLVRETYLLMATRGWLYTTKRDAAPTEQKISINLATLRAAIGCSAGIDMEREVRLYCQGVARQAL